MPSVIVDISSSVSMFADKRDLMDSHLKWDSIRKFVFLAYTYSNTVYNYDLFTKVNYGVSVYHFLFFQFTFGMAYFFMDFFVKLYTRRIDAPKLLNPLMRGVTFGLFLQTFVWTLYNVYRQDLTGCELLPTGLIEDLEGKPVSSSGRGMAEIMMMKARKLYQSNSTNYRDSFMYLEKSTITSRYFITAIVWVINFLFSTVSDDVLVKIFKLAFVWSTLSTVTIVGFLYMSVKRSLSIKAVYDIFDSNLNPTVEIYTEAAMRIAISYGIGFLGLHDFSCMSAFTMVDNAVVIFSMLFTAMAILRAWIIRVLFLVLQSCVKVSFHPEVHYLIYAVMPLSMEFFHADKLYIYYLYINILFSTTAYLMFIHLTDVIPLVSLASIPIRYIPTINPKIMLTLTMARLLHSEFNSVKNIYLVGMLCFMGFIFSLVIAAMPINDKKLTGLTFGLTTIIFCLGALKTGIILWVYGIKKFSTDIQFWLGFKPTRYWRTVWGCLPIILTGCFASSAYLLSQNDVDLEQLLCALAWITLTILTVIFFQIKTIARFLLKNNLANVLSSSKRYGPPDAEDRRRRRNFDVTIQLRQCKHNCYNFEEMIDCNHGLASQASSGDENSSLTNIYEARPTTTRRRTSAHIEVT